MNGVGLRTMKRRERRAPSLSRAWFRMSTGWLLLLAALRFSARLAFGQFALDWSTMDGGGGSSTGGVYSVSGTIGQPDTGTMIGGNFTLQGGFWAGVAVVQTPGAPTLTIQATNQTLVLIWLASATGFSLQESQVLGTTNWSNVTNVPVVVGGKSCVSLSPPAGNRFYRLHKP